jgi:hypothetical protein
MRRERLEGALADSESLAVRSHALAARAQSTRRRSLRLRRDAMELRFRHHQLARDTRIRLAKSQTAAGRQRVLTFPSAWSPLSFHPPLGLERIVVPLDGGAPAEIAGRRV